MYVSGIEKAIYLLLKLDSANEGALPLTLPVCFPNDDNNETSIKLKYYPLYFSEVLSHLALVMVEWKIKKNGFHRVMVELRMFSLMGTFVKVKVQRQRLR